MLMTEQSIDDAETTLSGQCVPDACRGNRYGRLLVLTMVQQDD